MTWYPDLGVAPICRSGKYRPEARRCDEGTVSYGYTSQVQLS